MRLETLSLREWRVFDELDLDFSDGLIGIRGQNGVGKTTLAEAIGWALFGKLRGRAKVSDLRRQDAPDGARSSVTLTFRIGDVRYRVERVVNGSARFWIGDGAEPETAQTRATNLRIAQELNMTWDLFCRTVYARQKDVAALDPDATGDARRQHVERLLGLGRVRDAAGKARDEHKRIKAELEGMRQTAPDLGHLRSQLADAERRAVDTPAVVAAEKAEQAARQAFDEARAAWNAEAVRATRHASLAPREEALELDVAKAKQRLEQTERRCRERDEAQANVERLRPQTAGAADIQSRRQRWQALADALDAHHDALEQLAGSDFDPELDAAQRADLERLRTELDELVVPEEPAALEARVRALEAVGDVGELDAALRCEQDAANADERAAREVTTLETRLAQERDHLEALSAEDGASCPVCLRPLEGSREALVAEHQARIERRADELERARVERLETERALAAARGAREAAARAAHALAETVGATTLAEASADLESAIAARAQALARQAELRKAIAELERTLRERDDLRVCHGELAAAVAARAQDVARHCRALGVDAYDAAAHAAASDAAERVQGLQEQLVRAEATVTAAVGCDSDRQAAADELRSRQEELMAVRGELARLAFDPAAHERLKGAEHAAESQWDECRGEAERLRVAAAEASAEVAGLRQQILAAEQLEREISATEAEARAHAVTFDVLSAYRDAQTQRAWPALEQSAGALLAQATDGRYADVRFSGSDFRLVIVDRGEEHPFDRYSGGEQDLANLCVRLAIADWIARERDVELGFVVLDEVFGSQDDDRRRGLIDQLRRLSERFHQMLVISHVAEIADQCDTVIALEQPEQGRSRIVA